MVCGFESRSSHHLIQPFDTMHRPARAAKRGLSSRGVSFGAFYSNLGCGYAVPFWQNRNSTPPVSTAPTYFARQLPRSFFRLLVYRISCMHN